MITLLIVSTLLNAGSGSMTDSMKMSSPRFHLSFLSFVVRDGVLIFHEIEQLILFNVTDGTVEIAG